MGSDAATANTSAPAVSKDVGGKKKKTNRSARLKQCKIDARREQWLSQVKNKSCKVVNVHASPPPTSPVPLTLHQMGKQNAPFGNYSEMRSRREDNDRPVGFHGGNLDSPGNVLPSTASSGNSSIQKDCLASGINHRPYLRSTSYADEADGRGVIKGEAGGEGRLDDWEAVADALTARAGGHSTQSSKCSATINESTGSALPHNGDGILRKPELDRRIPRAWRPDDVFRPRSLPKQQNLSSVNSQWYCGKGTVSWEHHIITSQPSLCPICYEDLDHTDSNFLPCSCGFHLCLFCHKRILEADGRCPGCRKPYSPLENGEMSMNGGGVPLLSRFPTLIE